jgi:anti-sigma factor RsiW
VTCRELVDFLAKYLDGGLSATERARFDEHLADCANCAAYLASYRHTVQICEEARVSGDEALPPDIPEALVQAIMAARRREGD